MSHSRPPYGIQSTLIEITRIPSCSDLFAHGCLVTPEGEGKVRITWPEGTRLDPTMDQYTLPSGFSVMLKPVRV